MVNAATYTENIKEKQKDVLENKHTAADVRKLQKQRIDKWNARWMRAKPTGTNMTKVEQLQARFWRSGSVPKCYSCKLGRHGWPDDAVSGAEEEEYLPCGHLYRRAIVEEFFNLKVPVVSGFTNEQIDCFTSFIWNWLDLKGGNEDRLFDIDLQIELLKIRRVLIAIDARFVSETVPAD
jgi:hypothetical protein